MDDNMKFTLVFCLSLIAMGCIAYILFRGFYLSIKYDIPDGDIMRCTFSKNALWEYKE